MNNFLLLKKTKKYCSKLTKPWSWPKFTLKVLIKLQNNYYKISLHFSVIVKKKFHLDTDLGGKMNADPCGSGYTTLIGRYRI